MDWLDFISSMTAALAWPIVAVIIALRFRKSIIKMMPDLRRLKAGPGGVEFEWIERKLEQVREELIGTTEPDRHEPAPFPSPSERTEEREPPEKLVPRKPNFRDEIAEIATTSPQLAVLEAYRRLEIVLRRALESRRPDLDLRNVSMKRLTQIAADEGIISPRHISVVEDLRAVRNEVAHLGATTLDRDQALEFAMLARQVIMNIEIASGRTINDWEGPGSPP